MNPEFAKIRNQIVEGMIISAQKLLEQKKKLGQKLVISENGVIKTVSPEELI
ncbi:MAG: hypothetical protein H0X62_07275 [Bacteroidetes bacterium]|nr:hypothetical protein [Bacteroidota bacterium]